MERFSLVFRISGRGFAEARNARTPFVGKLKAHLIYLDFIDVTISEISILFAFKMAPEIYLKKSTKD